MRESENRPRSARRVCIGCSESDDSCAPVQVAASRVARPATRWPTVRMHHAMPHQGVESPRVREPAPQRAPRAARAHAVPSRTTAVHLFATLHRHISGCPARHALRRATKGSRNARVREQAPQRANALQHCRTLCGASGTLPPPFLDGRKSVVSTARATCEHRRRLRSRMRTGNPRSQGWPNLSTCATGASTDATEDGATSISIDNG